MKFIFVFFYLVILLGSCSTEKKIEKKNAFEGLIEYAYSYQSDSLNIDTLRTQHPSSGMMIYKDSMYKSVFVANHKTETYIYNNAEGIAYDLSAEDSIDCEDYKIQKDSVLRYDIHETDEKILGHEVKILEFDTKYATQRFYFSTKFKVAPYNYDKHLAYNWKFYKEKANGGVLLKVEHIFKKFTMISIATKIEQKEIDPKVFEIDKSKLTTTCR